MNKETHLPTFPKTTIHDQSAHGASTTTRTSYGTRLWAWSDSTMVRGCGKQRSDAIRRPLSSRCAPGLLTSKSTPPPRRLGHPRGSHFNLEVSEQSGSSEAHHPLPGAGREGGGGSRSFDSEPETTASTRLEPDDGYHHSCDGTFRACG
eukprot:524338-Rhodomonas_salina.1